MSPRTELVETEATKDDTSSPNSKSYKERRFKGPQRTSGTVVRLDGYLVLVTLFKGHRGRQAVLVEKTGCQNLRALTERRLRARHVDVVVLAND